MEIIPNEIVLLIASDSEPVYLALIRAYPRLARLVTPGVRIDFMIGFGHSIRFGKNQMHRLRHGMEHCIYGPAILRVSGEEIWCINGERHRDDGPALITKCRETWYIRGEKQVRHYGGHGQLVLTPAWAYEGRID